MKQISVIIPTYNCKDLLAKTLESLCQQTLDRAQFEVIVCDDGSSDGTEQTVQSFSDRLKLSYCYQEDLGFRAAKARNMGLEKASAAYVFFLDSGVVIKPDVLALHLAAVEPHTFSIGFCDGFEEHAVTENRFDHLLAADDFAGLFRALEGNPATRDCRQQLLDEMGHQAGFDRYPWLFFWGGHLFGETAYFRQAGGFDENFTSWGGEDVEFGLRLSLAGFRHKLLLSARAYHIPHTKAPTAGAQATQNNCVYIHKKHQLGITKRMLAEDWEDIVRSVNDYARVA